MKTFNDLARIVSTARDPKAGKPTENNTRVRLVEGTVMDPKVLAVKFHNTDILRYYPDGSLDLVVGWEGSPTTNDRIWIYSGIRRYKQKLPLFYRRLPEPSTVTCVSHRGEGHIISEAHNGYIRYRPDRTIDLDSVREKEFTVWKDQKKLRKLMAKGRMICDQIAGLQKLGFRYRNPSTDGFFDDWLIQHLETPLEQLVPAEAPVRGATFTDNVMDPYVSLRAIGLRVARLHDCLETVKLKNFSR